MMPRKSALRRLGIVACEDPIGVGGWTCLGFEVSKWSSSFVQISSTKTGPSGPVLDTTK